MSGEEQGTTSNDNPPKESANNSSDGLSKKEVNQLSRIEFNSQSYASFYNTTMEKDKSILTLSVAGIGFLITLLKLTSVIQVYDMAFFSVATLSFLVAIYCVITIFGKNASFIIELTNGKDVQVKQYQLDQLDKWLIRSFYLGILMSLALGISTSSSLFLSKEHQMTKENSKPEVILTEQQVALDSYCEAVDIIKSFSGAAAIQAGSSSAQQSNSSSGSDNSSTGAAALMPQDDSE